MQIRGKKRHDSSADLFCSKAVSRVLQGSTEVTRRILLDERIFKLKIQNWIKKKKNLLEFNRLFFCIFPQASFPEPDTELFHPQ